MDEWRDFVVLMQDGLVVNLRAKRFGINDNKYVVAYDDRNMMAIIPLAEVKALFSCDVSQSLIDALRGFKIAEEKDGD